MKLLLDTHVLLWWLLDDPQLPAAVRRDVARAAAVYVSAASLWEVAIKQHLGKLPELHLPAAELPGLVRESDFLPLPIALEHAAAVAALPTHHKDPFDRLLAVQAQLEELTLVSADPVFARYPIKVRWR